MLPTLKPGDHIVTMRSWLAYPGGRAPARGDIVVFALPAQLPEMEGENENEMRRIIGDLQERIHIPPGSLKHINADILIKRVVGLPGETVLIKGKDVYINGSKLANSHFGAQGVAGPLQQYPFACYSPLKLSSDEVFVLGDNIENSEDGRYWGPLKRRNILGKFLRVLWNDGGKLSEKGADAAAAGSP
jgi:signal peptidase I